MNARTLRTVTQRLSLRKPQADSLENLADILNTVTLANGGAGAGTLETVQAICRERGLPLPEDFERDFPSLVFRLGDGRRQKPG